MPCSCSCQHFQGGSCRGLCSHICTYCEDVVLEVTEGVLPDAGSMAGGFFATSISGKMPAGIEASLSHLMNQAHGYKHA